METPLLARITLRWKCRLLAIGVIAVLVAALLAVAACVNWIITRADAAGTLPPHREDCKLLFVEVQLPDPDLAQFQAYVPTYICVRRDA